ncbi:hypothetical protein G7Y89_g275 [Cudoniella acicularis]|uniref:D-isomer specific 2-hydroxyacid dehydrogenase NAD-binding domain-containing protein n=1 Tax=Cudoniella acicularis TaxID=354080 RepID=A0A8H4RZH2_9HELO|nr:hypothetical protein G7Y89_g275 [Cudoniella acicularis]
MPPSNQINIVRLDGWVCPPPIFSPSFEHNYVTYDRTEPTTESIASRLKNMDVAITTRVPITAELLRRPESQKLKLVAVLAIGTDMVDLKACRERGVEVRNVPAASVEAVAEHALGLFFALRRGIVRMHNIMIEGTEWVDKGNLTSYFGGLPPTCKEEVVGIIGVGELANLTRALGMTVHLSEQKSLTSIRLDRLPFTKILETCTVIFLTLPLTPTTINLISTEELNLMRKDALLINVARGGIMDEEAVVKALKEGKIRGVASDVFLEEPASFENNILVKTAREDGGRGRFEKKVSSESTCCVSMILL